LRNFYDRAYLKDNYFGHKYLLYRPFVRSLIAATGLKRGSEVLDAGCGQGFFSHLFAAEGMKVYGTDMSFVGLTAARRNFVSPSTRFFVSDVARIPSVHQFDCVFIRSCSLFNTDQIDRCVAPTSELLKNVKRDGMLIFVYNTNVSSASAGWRHHRLSEIRRFLERSCGPIDLYFINKVDTLVLGHWAFNAALTRMNEFMSAHTGLGGEAVAVYRKCRSPLEVTRIGPEARQ